MRYPGKLAGRGDNLWICEVNNKEVNASVCALLRRGVIKRGSWVVKPDSQVYANMMIYNDDL